LADAFVVKFQFCKEERYNEGRVFMGEKFEMEIVDLESLPTKIDVLDSLIYSDDSPSFPVLYEKSQIILLRKTTLLLERSPAIKEIIDGLSTKENLIANMSQKGKEMYEKGEWVLKGFKVKDGLVPTLYDKNGKFAESLSLNIENADMNLSSALSNLAIQQQLGQVMNEIVGIKSSISRVERGQISDRIAIYTNAKQSFIMALNTEDKDSQQSMLLSAREAAGLAREQMIETTKNNIDSVIHDKSLSKPDRDKLSMDICEALGYIEKSTLLSIACSNALGENEPILATIKRYQVFIMQTLLSNINEKGASNVEGLHQNWPHADNFWLLTPKRIALQTDVLIERICNQNRIESVKNLSESDLTPKVEKKRKCKQCNKSLVRKDTKLICKSCLDKDLHPIKKYVIPNIKYAALVAAPPVIKSAKKHLPGLIKKIFIR